MLTKPKHRILGTRIKIIVISYEIVCAVDRYAPRALYLDTEAHPLDTKKKILRLDRTMNRTLETLILFLLLDMG